VSFALDGNDYAIDLTEEHAKELRAALSEYVENGRETGKPRKSRRKSPNYDYEKNQAIRRWAESKGITISERGRIPADVMKQYDAEH
jgi:hypothetical protein